MAQPIRIFVVDDHPMVVEGLTSALGRVEGFAVVGAAGTAEEALQALRRVPADIVLVDLMLPGASGAGLCAMLGELGAAPKCLVLSTSDRDDDVVDALSAGANGYLLKDITAAGLADAIRAVHRGDLVVDPRLTGKVVRGLRHVPSAVVRLSERDRELIRYIADGLSNSAIAERLHVSVSSVKNYVSRLMATLGVESRTAAVAKAAREGLL